MTLIEYYLKDIQDIADGSITPPEGIELTQDEPMKRAAQLQEQIQTMGVPEFVRRCAAQRGEEIPAEVYAAYQPEDLLAALQALTAQETPGAEATDPDAPPQIDEPDGPRSAYEVLLDCCCLDENLLYYLIDVLKRSAEEEFQKLALVTARKAFTQADFLYWFATKQSRAPQEELICVTLMDACFDRLAAEGQKELIAALLCGDQTTFELFRCDAPELMHLPEATFAWYERNYLQGYYPIRYMLKFNGVPFPKEEKK
ncbi:MAG: hypothetical protein IJG45_05875 [Oscillospiraceae bacterium]|nr:hypothetical protein [Oscillospiraceae bacterium]